MIDRAESAFMLNKWEDLIVKNHDEILAQNTYSKDQWALTKLADEFPICALPKGQVAFVADLWGRFSIKLMHLGLAKPATFVHYTSAKNEPSAPHFKTPMTRDEMQAAAAAAGSDPAATGSRLLLADEEESTVGFKRRESTSFVTRDHAPEHIPRTPNFQVKSHDLRKRRGGIRIPQHVQMRQTRLPGGAPVPGVHQAIHHGELPVQKKGEQEGGDKGE